MSHFHEYLKKLHERNPALFQAQKIQMSPAVFEAALQRAFEAGAKTASRDEGIGHALFDGLFGKGK